MEGDKVAEITRQSGRCLIKKSCVETKLKLVRTSVYTSTLGPQLETGHSAESSMPVKQRYAVPLPQGADQVSVPEAEIWRLWAWIATTDWSECEY